MDSLSCTSRHENSESFSISDKALKLTSEEDIKPHLTSLSELSKVTKIDLSGNTIGIDASIALAKHIENHKNISENVTEINFADLYTSRLVDEVVESLKVLLPVLLKCPKLELLNLSDNAFGLRTIDILEDYIANAVNLKHLILSNNGMGPFAGERIGRALYSLAQRKKDAGKPLLETFICGRNRLENGSAKCLALGLKGHAGGLKTVRLYQNGIRPNGIAILIKHGLKYNVNLEVLDLQDNTFTSGASMVLAEVLPQWKSTLKELNVNDCLLKELGCDAVLKVMLSNQFSSLKTLKLQYNEMNQKTLELALLPALENGNLDALKFLELNGNRLEEESEALETLHDLFNGEIDELDDLEELDSEAEYEGDEEEEEEEEEVEDVDLKELEEELSNFYINDLAKEVEKVHI
ncbi:GTPase-activating protein RNA1 Ecym_1469 [Eremothecium cymbalariae DBVPG|uniref:Ran GTPase-activating protein 1 n=1 Tax=Eremothecium cymbalariae (strain CBS 270.75 / DBVPG 7215 / KCTC 17166 / NRRL Y-17582) TaxID=931890 RepID=G8JMH8_ERECY|nr:hypothetical protein Ecym_1469 [Eremothecium cymbalariae DBVPG\